MLQASLGLALHIASLSVQLGLYVVAFYVLPFICGS